MIFGELTLKEAEGAILAHSVRAPGLLYKKGRVLSARDIAALQKAGVEKIFAAKLEPEDVAEDLAAGMLANACAGNHIERGAAFTGRANLFAGADGIAMIDRARVDRINLIDESLTIATVAPYEPLEKGQMAATIKIIPFSAPRAKVEEALAVLHTPLVQIAPWRPAEWVWFRRFLRAAGRTLRTRTFRLLRDGLPPWAIAP